MRYFKYTYVDAVTGVSVAVAAASHGPVPPAITGLEFGFSLESEYPTAVPTFYGTAPDDAQGEVAGILAEVTKAEFDAALASETSARNAITISLTKAQYEKAAQDKLDSAAQQAGYDNINNAVSYAEEPAVPKFQNDGKAFRAWRSYVWAYAYGVQDAVLAGTQEQLTLEKFLENMPKLSLPQTTA